MNTYAIKVRVLGTDINGIDKLLWATESQANEIRRRFNDPDLKNTMVTLGKTSFQVSGVLYIEEKEKEYYELPKYFLENAEKQAQLRSTN